jgi:hypothetical protein
MKFESIYASYESLDYETEAINLATRYFIELSEEKQRGFLQKIRDNYGEVSYDLLKYPFVSWEILNYALPLWVKKQIFETIPPFLEKEQVLELIRLEVWHCFYKEIRNAHKKMAEKNSWLRTVLFNEPNYDFRNIFESEDVLVFFTTYLSQISLFYPQPSEEVFKKYTLSKKDFSEILAIEKYLFTKKMIMLYDDYKNDVIVISPYLKKIDTSLFQVIYNLPFFNLQFHIVGFDPDKKNIIFRDFKPSELYFPNKIPILSGDFKTLLSNHLAEVEMIYEYHISIARTNLEVAKIDLLSIIKSYEKTNKITQNVKLDVNLNLKAGVLNAKIYTSVYWKKDPNLSIITLIPIIGIFASFMKLIETGNFIFLLPIIILGLIQYWIIQKTT